MKTQIFLIAGIILIYSGTFAQAQSEKDYYLSKKVSGSFEEVTNIVIVALKKEGFGVITEIDMHKSLKEKLDNIQMKPYKVLGVCNATFAYQTIQVEENIGLFLPCKVILKEIDNNTVEVVMVNPSSLMNMLGNEQLLNVAEKVTEHFRTVLKSI